ncbi:MAG: tRNA (adenosine(37)-N6)-threonylcarbamoyltransferase complex ATPase subunit type 1 TsaE [Defluviitaleaceae bacterium]|nr:tRNA (adenosine(37)-N6)-threonylcarbamoyltransferase complex ATPase subunit type 1 TsaE [Defluviitaleaceae bacterium]
MHIYKSYSAQDTMDIAQAMAKQATRGDIFLLNGTMGAGKTVFAKGFALGLGISCTITSPTFTLLNIYEGTLPMYHFDLYRCQEQVSDQGFEEYFFGTGICLIEWGEYAKNILPHHNTITIQTSNNPKQENFRTIEVINK